MKHDVCAGAVSSSVIVADEPGNELVLVIGHGFGDLHATGDAIACISHVDGDRDGFDK
jgi:hypothetical protein